MMIQYHAKAKQKIQYQYHYQSQIYLARASFVIKNAIGGATWEWGANCPCDGGSSMSSSETWNTEVCCTVVTHVVIHSRFVVQPQKSDGDQNEVSVRGTVSRSIVEERRDRNGSYGFNMFFG